ncbi:MAG: glycosyltransferase family 4 protein, partial [Rhodospirillaceae bacterium]|nr:glycosyltransferase family 4 protein [Rhodospirillaceae bacterium]
MPRPVAFVLKGYPRLSETFIAQEIRALERRGLDIRIVSLRHPTDPADHPVHREIVAPVDYLPEYLGDDWARVSRAWRKARCLPGYPKARALWLRDLRRDPSRNRVRRFGQALVLAAELPPEIGRLHAHFLHTPASVARYAATMRGLPWSCSAHAKDIWTTPAWDKREKLADLDWLVTCTAVGRDHLAGLAPEPARVLLAYHGLDLARFPPPEREAGGEGRAADPVTILSVGRAVEKKGYEDLLDALAALPAGPAWRFVHIGGGKRLAALKARADELGLGDRIEWLGPQPQETVLARYRTAGLFVLASRIAADGDRDGLPNVLVEAQSQGLACLGTCVSAIPELIRDGETGLLVPPGDPPALAEALARMIVDPALRARLGAAG